MNYFYHILIAISLATGVGTSAITLDQIPIPGFDAANFNNKISDMRQALQSIDHLLPKLESSLDKLEKAVDEAEKTNDIKKLVLLLEEFKQTLIPAATDIIDTGLQIITSLTNIGITLPLPDKVKNDLKQLSTAISDGLHLATTILLSIKDIAPSITAIGNELSFNLGTDEIKVAKSATKKSIVK